MLAPVSEAIQRFRARLRWAAFVRGTLRGFFVVAVAASLWLLCDRLLDGALASAVAVVLPSELPSELPGLLPGLLPSELPSLLPQWVWWSLLFLMSLLPGFVRAKRDMLADADIVTHLERRLGTNGVLLAASEGVALDAAFEARLTVQLGDLRRVLPAVQWRDLLWRPLAALLLLLAMFCLPARTAVQRSGEAVAVATQRLQQDVEQLAELVAVPEERLAELRQVAAELHQRAASGDGALWREVDQLRERIAREQQVAEAAAGDLAHGGPNASSAAREQQRPGEPQRPGQPIGQTMTPSVHQLASGMVKLGQVSPAALQGMKEHVPQLDPAAQQAVAASIQPDGSVDAAQLPREPAARDALADAVATVAAQLAKDPGALADMSAGLTAEDRSAMEQQLQALAQEFSRSRGADTQRDPGSLADAGQGSEAGAKAQEAASATAADPDKAAELRTEVAKAAIEMAKAGALEQLPSGVQEAMMKAGLSALEGLDPETLMSLLPDDLSQLLAMGQSVAELAKSMQITVPDGQPTSLQPGDMKLSPELLQKMAELQKGLMAKLAGAAPELQALADAMPAGGDRNQASQPGSGDAQSAESNSGAQGSEAAPTAGSGGQSGIGGQSDAGGQRGVGGQSGIGGVAGDAIDAAGGGHAALRLTEETLGSTGATEMVLPERRSDELPSEWQPAAVAKAEPEVGKTQAAGAGRAGASGSGGATWQLRLMPRHRDVVRRFFAEKDK